MSWICRKGGVGGVARRRHPYTSRAPSGQEVARSACRIGNLAALRPTSSPTIRPEMMRLFAPNLSYRDSLATTRLGKRFGQQLYVGELIVLLLARILKGGNPPQYISSGSVLGKCAGDGCVQYTSRGRHASRRNAVLMW